MNVKEDRLRRPLESRNIAQPQEKGNTLRRIGTKVLGGLVPSHLRVGGKKGEGATDATGKKIRVGAADVRFRGGWPTGRGIRLAENRCEGKGERRRPPGV